MPAKPGTNRFEAFQVLKQQGRAALIAEFLAYLKTSRIRCRNVTELAEMVALHIAETQGKPCNKATLLRNPRYKSLLLTYMAQNLEPGTRGLSVKCINDPKTHALVMSMQVESSNLKRDNDRLRSYVAHLEERFSKDDSLTKAAKNDSRCDVQPKIDEAQLRFARVCQTLQLVIRNLDSLISVDVRARQIVDMTRSRNNVIADSEISSDFFEWLEANRGIG